MVVGNKIFRAEWNLKYQLFTNFIAGVFFHFPGDKVKVFVGNIKAAGVGLTLTAGEAVIMNDLSFLPSDHAQAEDRSYRYGQKNNVLVYYPIFENTIEGIIYDILNNKKQVIATVMGDNLNSSDMAEEILKRINEIRK